MCGIAGAFSSDARWPVQARLDAALDLLRHRGPDDRGVEILQRDGVLGLGHARLSIIDLSAGGHQPMRSACGRYLMVFNGEIYNYRELRQELQALGERFHTASDSEVLLAAWARWGRDCLPRLLGMFAFVVADLHEARLHCVRDAFGIKPMYLASHAGWFGFASELPALLALRGRGAELDLQRCYDYLVHGDYDSTPGSFVADIEQLEAGTTRSYDLRTAVLGPALPWWQPEVAQTCTLSFADAAARLRELFLDSVRMHLRSDVALGAALSGGIDSSAVVCAMRHLEPDAPIHTFSFIARGSPLSEESWVDLVNARVGATSHRVEVEPEELARDLDDLIRAQGEPFGSTSIYAQYRVFRLAREQGVTVTLDGQGADELHAGYLGYPGRRMRSLLERGEWLRGLRLLRNWSKGPGRSLGYALKATAAEYAQGALYQRLRTLHSGALDPDWIDAATLRERGVRVAFPLRRPAHSVRGRRLVGELALSATRRGLPGLLRHGDRNSMRFSVESRVPFLTLQQAEFLFSVPEHYLLSDDGQTKHLLRAAMRGLVPDAILDRRDKIGFATPEQDWLRRLAPQARAWLSEDIGVDFLDQPRMLRAFDAMLEGRVGFSWQAWRWINFCRWHALVFQPLRAT